MGSLRHVTAVPARQAVPSPRTETLGDGTVPAPRQEPILVRGDGRVYVVLEYDENDDGTIVPTVKLDVTESFDDLSSGMRIAHGPALYLFASQLHKLANTPNATRESQVSSMAATIAVAIGGGRSA